MNAIIIHSAPSCEHNMHTEYHVDQIDNRYYTLYCYYTVLTDTPCMKTFLRNAYLVSNAVQSLTDLPCLPINRAHCTNSFPNPPTSPVKLVVDCTIIRCLRADVE